VIGSGPAGYVAAIRAGQTGLKTLVIDRKYIGGMCLNWGCIPTKALLESAKTLRKVRQASDYGITGIDKEALGFDWPKARERAFGVVNKLTRGIEFLWKKAGVEFLQAEARIISPTEVVADQRSFETKAILIATGSKPMPQVLFPKAIELEELFSLPALPDRPLIYGRGANLVELAQFFALIGKQVTILASDLPLIPQLDSALDSFMQKKLKKDKISIIPLAESKIQDGILIYKDTAVEFDAAINASFRNAVIPQSEVELKLQDGFIHTDRNHETSVKGIYAAGDVNGKSYLAHAASAQGLEVVNALNGIEIQDELRRYPLNIYTDPEMAQVGKTEAQLKAEGQEYQVSQYPLTANGKALAEGESEGFIRLLWEPHYHEVLGVQIVAANATDLISEAGILLELEGTTFDLARTIHAHPTISEIYMEAGMVE
jgi:dihydrolipoamide dehydrogenase